MLLWIEGFEGFGATDDTATAPTGIVGRKYPQIGFENKIWVRAGRFGGHALQLAYDNTCRFGPDALTTDATLIVGCALKWNDIPTGTGAYPMFLAFYDGSTAGMNVIVDASGELSVRRGGTVLATTSGHSIPTGAWFYLEFKVVCNSSGSYELRVNGETVLSATGVNTKAGTHNYHDRFRVTGTSTDTAKAVYVDDLYCCDGSGAVHNDFLGPRKVLAIFPNGAGDSTQWTPSSGDNYAAVDEQQVDDDTSYVEVSSTGQKDLYGYGALGETVSGITGVQVTTTARVTDVTPMSLYPRVKSGATEVSGSEIVVGNDTYVSFSQVWATDPNTSAAWTQSNLEAAQFGILS